MRILLKVLTCGVPSFVLAFAAATNASASGSQSESPPWVIGNNQSGAGLYVPREVRQAYDKGTRSADGRPGPKYWQNQADHQIRITVLGIMRPRLEVRLDWLCVRKSEHCNPEDCVQTR
jgi:hypothetical protein